MWNIHMSLHSSLQGCTCTCTHVHGTCPYKCTRLTGGFGSIFSSVSCGRGLDRRRLEVFQGRDRCLLECAQRESDLQRPGGSHGADREQRGFHSDRDTCELPIVSRYTRSLCTWTAFPHPLACLRRWAMLLSWRTSGFLTLTWKDRMPGAMVALSTT